MHRFLFFYGQVQIPCLLTLACIGFLLVSCSTGIIHTDTVSDVNANVWIIDDGEKIRRNDIDLRFKSGTDNPIWSPGEPIKLFSIRNETVAFQAVIENMAFATLNGVTVDLDSLAGPEGAEIKNAEGATNPSGFVGRYIERFVENFFFLDRHSGLDGDDGYLNSQGWNWGAGPGQYEWIGWMPDALIPVEIAPQGAPYPLVIGPENNGIVWIDITVPKDQRPGTYKGNVIVSVNGSMLKSLAIELEVYNAVLADRPVNTMVCYDEAYPSTFERCFGEQKQAAIRHLWKLYRRHRLSPMIYAHDVDDVITLLPVLHGSFYSLDNGYEGPGQGLGEGVLSLGRYGSFSPNANNFTKLEEIATKLAEENLFSTTDVFIYALDEDCSDENEAVRDWRVLLDWSNDPNVDNVRLGWTCSQPVEQQQFGADLVMKQAAFYHPEEFVEGKIIWIYNGTQPHTGAFLTDLDAISIRVNGWLAGIYNIKRWFYWSSTAWYDQFSDRNIDPYVEPCTFDFPGADSTMGGGMLAYPGSQLNQPNTKFDMGMIGVIASIRLKNWRRGIQDAGYYQLAHAANPAEAEKIVTDLKLFPDCVLAYINEEGSEACKLQHPPVWSTTGKVFFDARKKLLELIPEGSQGYNATSGVGKSLPP